MSGRGKGAKGMAKRHLHGQKNKRGGATGLTDASIKKLSLRGGVKRIGAPIYEAVRRMVHIFEQNVLRDVVTYTEHSRRKTISVADVKVALERQGLTLYGFSGGSGAGIKK